MNEDVAEIHNALIDGLVEELRGQVTEDVIELILAHKTEDVQVVE